MALGILNYMAPLLPRRSISWHNLVSNIPSQILHQAVGRGPGLAGDTHKALQERPGQLA